MFAGRQNHSFFWHSRGTFLQNVFLPARALRVGWKHVTNFEFDMLQLWAAFLGMAPEILVCTEWHGTRHREDAIHAWTVFHFEFESIHDRASHPLRFALKQKDAHRISWVKPAAAVAAAANCLSHTAFHCSYWRSPAISIVSFLFRPTIHWWCRPFCNCLESCGAAPTRSFRNCGKSVRFVGFRARTHTTRNRQQTCAAEHADAQLYVGLSQIVSVLETVESRSFTCVSKFGRRPPRVRLCDMSILVHRLTSCTCCTAWAVRFFKLSCCGGGCGGCCGC